MMQDKATVIGSRRRLYGSRVKLAQIASLVRPPAGRNAQNYTLGPETECVDATQRFTVFRHRGVYRQMTDPEAQESASQTRAEEPTVGVIGIGNMGTSIARQVADSFEVVAYDRDPDQVAPLEGPIAVARTRREVAERTDIVLLSLPSSDAVESVVLGEGGVLDGLSPGTVLVDTSTIDPAVTRTVSSACDSRRVTFLDAPVSGGPRNAVDGALTTMVGGEEAAVDRLRPVFSCYCDTVVHVGERGAGIAMKLANNYMFGVQTAAVCEALTMARRAGIDDETFFEVASSASGDSYALRRNLEGFVLPGEYEPEGSLSILGKDVRLAEQFGRANDVPLPVGGTTSSIFRLAETRGWGGRDLAALLALYDDTEPIDPA